MSLETDTNVEEMRQVQTEDGDTTQPTNVDEQKAIRESLSNQDSLEAFEFSTGSTDPEPLPANEVPDGIEVLVTYLPDNGDIVNVGSEAAQPATLAGSGQGVWLRVSDTSEIYVQTPTAGDGVGVLFES